MRVALAPPLCEVAVLAEALGASITPVGTPRARVRGIATHAGECQAGDLFLAMRGKRLAGTAFVAEALARGAGAILTDTAFPPPVGSYWLLSVADIGAALLHAAAYWRQRLGARVIAVAGSTGKTTVKEMIAALLLEKYTVCKSTENYNSGVGMPLSLLSMSQCAYAVLELGINARGEMAALSRALSPDIAVLTNVGSAHVGHFRDGQELLAEKLSLAEGVSASGWLVLPETLPVGKGLAPHVLRTGVGRGADVLAAGVRYGSFGTLATVSSAQLSVPELCWPVAGRAGLSCLLFAVAVGRLAAMDAAEIRAGVARAAAETPRMRRAMLGERILIDDTYNASPEAMLSALEGLAYTAAGRPMAAVLGDMGELGEKSRLYHETVGMLAAGADPCGLYFYGDFAEAYATGARRAGLPDERIRIFRKEEGRELAECLLTTLPRNAAVLFKASHSTALDRVVKMLEEALK